MFDEITKNLYLLYTFPSSIRVSPHCSTYFCVLTQQELQIEFTKCGDGFLQQKDEKENGFRLISFYRITLMQNTNSHLAQRICKNRNPDSIHN